MQTIQIKPYPRKVHFYETDQMGIETRHCAIRTQKQKVVSLEKEIPEPFDLFSSFSYQH